MLDLGFISVAISILTSYAIGRTSRGQPFKTFYSLAGPRSLKLVLVATMKIDHHILEGFSIELESHRHTLLKRFLIAKSREAGNQNLLCGANC